MRKLWGLLDSDWLEISRKARLALLYIALIGALLLASKAFCDEPFHRPTTLPAKPPLTVVIVTDCHRIPYALIATMADGTIELFDAQSSLNLKDILPWAQKARHAVVSEMPCGSSTDI